MHICCEKQGAAITAVKLNIFCFSFNCLSIENKKKQTIVFFCLVLILLFEMTSH
jgi:hypothetical protein